MNKTIIININGTIFHIEEDAYELLKIYMTGVKRHFSTSADSLEITTDIENRVAEMFSEILVRDNKQVIVEQDVAAVVEQMGSVEDFEHDGSNEAGSHFTGYAGNLTERRLFRDTDDHLVGGVCAGIANYFNINPVWVRLAFALLCAAGGSGVIIYAILWIVVPKAVTRADRMAMKGEKQNLQGFKRNFEEETSAMRQNLANFADETKPFIYKARDFFGDVGHHTGRFLGATGIVILKIFGVLLLIACFAACIALIVTLITIVGFGAGRPQIFFPFSVIGNQYADKVYISAFLVAFIPLIALIMVIIRGVFNTRRIHGSVGTVFLVVWLCALGVLIYLAAVIATDFRESARFKETLNLKPSSNNTYYLKLNDVKFFTSDDSVRLDMKDHFHNMIITDEENNSYHGEPRSVTISIERSDVAYPVLEESFRASGYDFEKALYNARNTSYMFSQKDSVLTFDYTIRKNLRSSWHAEEVNLTLKIPVNAKVIIDERLDNYMDNGSMVYDCKTLNKKDNINFAQFTMTANGLQCNVDTLVTSKADTTAARQIMKDSTGTIQDTTANKF